MKKIKELIERVERIEIALDEKEERKPIKHHLVVTYLNKDNKREKYNLYVEHPIMGDYLGFRHFPVAEKGFIIEDENAYVHIQPNRIVEIILMKSDKEIWGIDEIAITRRDNVRKED